MFRRAVMIATCAAVLGLVTLAPAHAIGTWRRTMYLTFNRSVALPGVTLAAGTYIFERADVTGRTDLVQVTSRDRSRLYLLAFTNRTARPVDWPADQYVSIGEAPAGAAPPILVWYPVNERMGHQFIYSGR